MRFHKPSAGILLALTIVAGCSGHGTATPPMNAQLPMPKSISPALIKPAPMARTAILPPSAMRSPRSPDVALRQPTWKQIPGTAALVAAGASGDVWVLSNQPAGADKYIWHYSSGSWTNISGLADRLAVAPNGTLYAVNSGGGVYAYKAGAWSALGGGAGAITVAVDGSVYVTSNAGIADHAVWRYSANGWTRVAGTGVALAASPDTAAHQTPWGTLKPGGIYILNGAGAIYYENTDQTFVHLPGAASAATATSQGGLYVLAYPSNGGGTAIYYYDLDGMFWTQQSGAAVSLSAYGSNLYAISASGGIYRSEITARTPMIVVANRNSNQVLEFPLGSNGNVAPSVVISGANTNFATPTGVAFAFGNLYTVNDSGHTVYIFDQNASGNATPLNTITDSTALAFEQIMTDQAGTLYAPDYGKNAIVEYAPGAGGSADPTRTIVGANTGLSAPLAVAFDAQDNLWAAGYNFSLLKYAAGANGNTAPLATISGSNTQLGNETTGIAVDAAGEIIATTNYSEHAILVYAAGANGNVAPIRVITGTNTQLQDPEALAVDASGNIWVTDPGANAIFAFAAGANGNVAPIAAIKGTNTLLNVPIGLTFTR